MVSKFIINEYVNVVKDIMLRPGLPDYCEFLETVNGLMLKIEDENPAPTEEQKAAFTKRTEDLKERIENGEEVDGDIQDRDMSIYEINVSAEDLQKLYLTENAMHDFRSEVKFKVDYISELENLLGTDTVVDLEKEKTVSDYHVLKKKMETMEDDYTILSFAHSVTMQQHSLIEKRKNHRHYVLSKDSDADKQAVAVYIA